MNELSSFATEDSLKVEVLRPEHAPDFTGSVIGNTRSAGARSAICKIDLVTIAPGTTLIEFGALVAHVPACEIVLDEAGDGAVFDKGGQNLNGKSEVGEDAADIRLRTGHLHLEVGAAMKGLAVQGSEARSHAGGNHEGMLAVLFKLHLSGQRRSNLRAAIKSREPWRFGEWRFTSDSSPVAKAP